MLHWECLHHEVRAGAVTALRITVRQVVKFQPPSHHLREVRHCSSCPANGKIVCFMGATECLSLRQFTLKMSNSRSLLKVIAAYPLLFKKKRAPAMAQSAVTSLLVKFRFQCSQCGRVMLIGLSTINCKISPSLSRIGLSV